MLLNELVRQVSKNKTNEKKNEREHEQQDKNVKPEYREKDYQHSIHFLYCTGSCGCCCCCIRSPSCPELWTGLRAYCPLLSGKQQICPCCPSFATPFLTWHDATQIGKDQVVVSSSDFHHVELVKPCMLWWLMLFDVVQSIIHGSMSHTFRRNTNGISQIYSLYGKGLRRVFITEIHTPIISKLFFCRIMLVLNLLSAPSILLCERQLPLLSGAMCLSLCYFKCCKRRN